MSAEFDIDNLVEESNLDDVDFNTENETLDDGEAAWDTSDTLDGEVLQGDLILDRELTEDEATELTENIRSTGEVLYVLVSRAHAGKAHLALGYSSFESYVKEEFGMSRSRAYQLIGQANVIKEISEAVPEGTEISISEAAARDLKGMLDKVVPSIAERTGNLSPEEAGKVVQDTVDEFRGTDSDDLLGDLSDEDIDALLGQDLFATGQSYDEELMGDLRDREGFSSTTGGGSGGGSGNGSGNGGYDVDEDLPDFDMELPDLDSDIDLDDNGDDTDYDVIYEFYSVITTLSQFPEPEKIIENIAEARVRQINESAGRALEWLTDFVEKWEQKQGDNVDE